MFAAFQYLSNRLTTTFSCGTRSTKAKGPEQTGLPPNSAALIDFAALGEIIIPERSESCASSGA